MRRPAKLSTGPTKVAARPSQDRLGWTRGWARVCRPFGNVALCWPDKPSGSRTPVTRPALWYTAALQAREQACRHEALDRLRNSAEHAGVDLAGVGFGQRDAGPEQHPVHLLVALAGRLREQRD